MSLDADIRLLSRVQLFAGFEHDHLRLLAFGAETRRYIAGDRIYREGSASDGGYVISSGHVELISGRDDRTVTSHTNGSLISELGLITETLHAATAVATQETEVLRISRPLFLRMLNEYPHLARLLQSRLVSSVEEFSRQLAVIRAKLDHATDLATRKPKVAKTGD